MTSRPLWLSLFSGVAHLLIGVPELFRWGPRSLPTSWVTIYYSLPDWAEWIWPALFVLTGIVAVLGARVPRMAWLGFRLCAVTFAVWAMVGAWAWSQSQGGNIPGSTGNFIIAVFAWVLADYVALGVASGHIDKQVAVLAEKIEAVANGG